MAGGFPCPRPECEATENHSIVGAIVEVGKVYGCGTCGHEFVRRADGTTGPVPR